VPHRKVRGEEANEGGEKLVRFEVIKKRTISDRWGLWKTSGGSVGKVSLKSGGGERGGSYLSQEKNQLTLPQVLWKRGSFFRVRMTER